MKLEMITDAGELLDSQMQLLTVLKLFDMNSKNQKSKVYLPVSAPDFLDNEFENLTIERGKLSGAKANKLKEYLQQRFLKDMLDMDQWGRVVYICWNQQVQTGWTHPASVRKCARRSDVEQSDSDQQRRSLLWNPLITWNPGTKVSWLDRSHP